uniref:Uncharacterized protein ycf33 n=1 Tax=Ishige okamurae TaxID=233772 RepID=A0A8E5XRJ7_9PHAE|nr:hypothetical protein Ycf33 [Ishige okamurae]QVJ99654.1 hypothetical protein Ycf33 [Ishige okamurae]WAM64090.1 hypothetical protein [Ishige okamurae]
MIFWDNLLRYPRFFISSVVGLVLIILNPIIVSLKKFQNEKLIFLIIFTCLITLSYIIKKMVTIE